MDVVGPVAGIIGLIHLSHKAFGHCQNYYSAVKGARDDICRLRDDLMRLQDVLIHVSELADIPKSSSSLALDHLNQPDGLVALCRSELEKLITTLEAAKGDESMRKFGLRALKWPFTRKDLEKIL